MSLDSEPEIVYKEDCLNSSTSLSSSTCTTIESDKSETKMSIKTEIETQTCQSKTNSTLYILVVDDVVQCYVNSYDKAYRKVDFNICNQILSETDRAFFTEWYDHHTCVLKSYPKFSLTRYDRVEHVFQIIEVEEGSEEDEVEDEDIQCECESEKVKTN